jgi:hypothetical protein
MLLSNQCIDKLSSARNDFTSCRMLDGSVLTAVLQSYCVPPPLSLDHIAELFVLDDLHPPDDTQDGNSSDEPTASSGAAMMDIDEPLETWPVNDPLAVAEVMLAARKMQSMCMTERQGSLPPPGSTSGLTFQQPISSSGLVPTKEYH